MTFHRIDCITKDDRYNEQERIRFVGGPGNGKRWRQAAELKDVVEQLSRQSLDQEAGSG